MDLILTGRGVGAAEALEMGLANRVCEPGSARAAAVELAEQIAAFPQVCLRNDRRSALDQWELPDGGAMAFETRIGLETLASAEAVEGAARFARGAGRGGVVE
jgi:enoyl-CoA hydratase